MFYLVFHLAFLSDILFTFYLAYYLAMCDSLSDILDGHSYLTFQVTFYLTFVSHLSDILAFWLLASGPGASGLAMDTKQAMTYDDMLASWQVSNEE